MAKERTLSIIKPDAVQNNHIGSIIQRLEKNHLKVINIKMIHLSRQEAEHFYDIHTEKPFFDQLVAFMTSGPIIVMILEGDNAVETNRKTMGATDPKQAEPGTIRHDFASSIDANAVHGS